MKWSFSAIKQLTTCAKQYHEVRVLNNFVIPDTEHTLYGKAVHTSLEEYVRNGKPLPKNYQRFQKAVDALMQIPGERHVELKMGLKEDRVTACDFDDPEYWVHGIADLVIINSNEAFSVDYKTGSPRYVDTKQLKLMALMIFAKFPAIERVRSGLLFLLHDMFVPDDYDRSQIDKLWKSFREPLELHNIYTTSGNWPANPSGLCKKFCPVSTCTYHGSYK